MKTDKVVGSSPIIILGFCFLLSQMIILNILVKLNVRDVFFLQTTFNSGEFVEIISDWKSKGVIDYYLQHYYFDFIHPVLYATFLWLLLRKALNRNGAINKNHYVLYLPFLAGLFDEIENSLHLYMILQDYYPSKLIILSSVFSNSKWIITAFCLVILLYLLFKKK